MKITSKKNIQIVRFVQFISNNSTKLVSQHHSTSVCKPLRMYNPKLLKSLRHICNIFYYLNILRLYILFLYATRRAIMWFWDSVSSIARSTSQKQATLWGVSCSTRRGKSLLYDFRGLLVLYCYSFSRFIRFEISSLLLYGLS